MLGGATVGLALAPLAPSGPDPGLIAVPALCGAGIAAARPRRGQRGGWPWIALVSLAALLGGLALGGLRLAAIDGGAFDGPVSRPATVRGFVTAVPRRSRGRVAVRIQTADGRLAVEATEPVPDLPIGREVVARGTVMRPAPWEVGYLERYGIREVLDARSVDLTGSRRGGLVAIADRVRDNAEVALGRGTPGPEEALLRGFLLGEDDRIDPATVEDFKRSGLAHLLAVSGDTVMLLSLLAVALLGLFGVPLRLRLVCVGALIALYVPVTGAGPSIQRAGIMGATGVVAALAERPRSRWYAVAVAALLTLALNPRASGDIGWQLSFAAVIGILLWASRIRDLVLGPGAPPAASGRRLLAEGAGVTVSATLATAPLMASAFDAISIASLPANILALPAVAPMMWLGILSCMAGQIPAIPVEPLTWLAGLLSAYVAQIAHWLGSPAWARLTVRLDGVGPVVVAYVATTLLVSVGVAWAARRRGLRDGSAAARAFVVAVAVALGVAWIGSLLPSPAGPQRAPGLRVRVLDVGQGDAILLDPRDGGPVLVDGGPPHDELRAKLADDGVSRLAAAVVTHDQADHAGGIEELLGAMPIGRLLCAEPGRDFLGPARAAGVRTRSVAEGASVDSGSLRLQVLWPPRPLLDGGAPGDPNEAAIVTVARWHEFSILLTADAEADAVPIDPGPIDVLKVAHHGSDDSGLDGLLDRTAPRLAVVSVGSGNPYGHPTPSTLATLASHGVPVLRTDDDGEVAIDATRRGWTVSSSD
ncbi:MAG: ComEC/Rec2 family competence protein [Solirubrobacterales bacterium]